MKYYLENEALNYIAGLLLTNENHEEAMKLLSERYGEKKNIISSNVNELLEIRSIGSETSDLRSSYDLIESQVRKLQRLGVKGQEYGTILSPFINKPITK